MDTNDNNNMDININKNNMIPTMINMKINKQNLISKEKKPHILIGTNTYIYSSKVNIC